MDVAPQTLRIWAALKELDSCKALSHCMFSESSSLKRIYDQAFRGSGPTEISIPDGVEELGHSCLCECELSQVSRPRFGEFSSLKMTGISVFYASGLKEILEGIPRKAIHHAKIQIIEATASGIEETNSSNTIVKAQSNHLESISRARSGCALPSSMYAMKFTISGKEPK